jgi:predicted aldo/keto reductase-like oxidoreductase
MTGCTRREFVLGVSTGAGVSACTRDSERQSAPRVQSATPAKASPAPVSSPPQVRAPAREGMPERRLGKTGVSVSMLGLGGFHVAEKLGRTESVRLIRRAIDRGITFLDNCWDYNDGKSESFMGSALADGYRERVFLMTKIDGRTRSVAAAQLEQSLRRLRTERIDLVQIHEVIREDDPERCFAVGGAIEALLRARETGKLRFIGFTGHKHPAIHLAMLRRAKQSGFEFDAVQLPLNVMDAHFRSFEKEVLPVLVASGAGVLGMKSMGAGDILDAGVVTPEECLRYALSLPTSVVISGMDNVEVLEKNLKLVKNFRPLTPVERAALLARTAPYAAGGKHEPFKTSEKYDGTRRNPHWLESARL